MNEHTHIWQYCDSYVDLHDGLARLHRLIFIRFVCECGQAKIVKAEDGDTIR